MTDREDIDMLAAEYVLGTLDHDERASVTVRRHREPELAAAIDAWQQRLMPLGDQVENMQPSADVFAKIAQRISNASAPLSEAAPASKSPGPAEVIKLKNQVSRWRLATVAASAMAAAFAGLLFRRRIASGTRSTVRCGFQSRGPATSIRDVD